MERQKTNGSCRISDHINTWDPALRVIRSKGFKIFIYPDAAEGNLGNFWAIKENRDFMADDPLKLLGLIAMWENLGDDWGSPDAKKVLDEVTSKAFPDSVSDLEKLSQFEFDNLVADYQIFFGRIFPKDIIPSDVSRKSFFNILENWYKWDLEDFYGWEAQ